MNPYELAGDIAATKKHLVKARDFETRLALQRLVDILQTWKVTARKKG